MDHPVAVASLVARALVRDPEHFTVGPKPTDGEFEVGVFHLFMAQREELAVFIIHAGLVAPSQAFLGCKVVKVVGRETSGWTYGG